MINLRQITKTKLGKFQPKETKSTGFLGRNDGVVRVPGRDNYVFVRLWDGSIVEAFNNSVPALAGLPVEIIYKTRRYWVSGAARDTFAEPVFCVPDGLTATMQWPGANTLYVRGEQFIPGLVAALGGMTIRIYPTDEYPGEDFDLTSHIPASGARWALVEVNDTAAHIVDGDIVTIDTLNDTPKPSPTAGYVQKAAVRLYAGQVSILSTASVSDIIDKRFDSAPATSNNDATYLRLDAANAPVTGELPIGDAWTPPATELWLRVVKEISSAVLALVTFSDTDTSSNLMFWRSLGSILSPSAVTAGKRIGGIVYKAFNGSVWPGTKRAIIVEANENHTPTAAGARLGLYIVPDGTTAHQEAVRLDGTKAQFTFPVDVPERASPGTPGTGFGRLWVDPSTKHLMFMDDTGTATDLM